MIESLLHKFYAASITVAADGSMIVASTRERFLIWAILFCLVASFSLVAWLIWRKRHMGKLAMGSFFSTLLIPVFILPSIRNEYIHVSPRTLTIESGTWYRPSTKVLPMHNIRNIREIEQESAIPSNLIGDPNVNWHLTWLDGKSEMLELNDFFSAHRMVVAYYYKDRGYWLERLEDQTVPAHPARGRASYR